MKDESTRKMLKQASTYAGQPLTMAGMFKDTHGPRPITLASLESKLALDQEIFGEETARAIRDRFGAESPDE